MTSRFSMPLLMAVTLLSAPAFAEHLSIDKQIILSPGHLAMPHIITRASDGDLIVLGSNDQADSRAWATRVAPTGEVRWEFIQGGPDGWNDHSAHGQRFYGAIEMPDQTTLLCGIKDINNTNTVMLVRLDKDGKLLSEALLPPVRDNVVISLYSCHKRSDGIVLMGSVSGQPAGTAWMAKLDWDFKLQWKKFSDDFGLGEFIETGDSLTALGWHAQEYYVVKIAPDGEITAKHLLSAGEHHLVQTGTSDPAVRIVTMVSTYQTEILDFDAQLRGPTHTLKLHNVGVKKCLGLPDGTVAIFGSQFHNGATTAVTRVYKDGSSKGFLVDPSIAYPWHNDAVLTGKNAEIAAVGRNYSSQAVLDWISFK
jgi:hypothetical protein